MARRDSGRLTGEFLLITTVSLVLMPLGCGRSSLDVLPADVGLVGGVGGAGGVATTAAGGAQATGGASLVAGASSAAGATVGGVPANGGASTLLGGSVSDRPTTGGTTMTGGASDSRSSTGGRGGQLTAGTTQTGGKSATGGMAGTGGSGGRTNLGGSSSAVITAGTSTSAGASGSGGMTVRGGTSGGGASVSGGTSGNGGTTTTGGSAGASTTGGTTTGGTGGGSGGTTTGGTGGGSGGSGGIGGSTAATLFQPLADAFCTAAKSCCAREAYPVEHLVDCESKFLSRLESYPLVDKGTVLVDEKALAACTSAYKAAATACTINPVRTACRGVFVGLGVEGQPCGGTSRFGAVECKPVNGSATCYRPQGNTDPKSAGTCVSIPRGKSGDACSTTCQKGKTCIVDMLGGTAPFPATCFEEDGFYCAMALNPAVCKPLLPIGGTCDWGGNPCGSGNVCSWGPTSTCVVAGKIGESCAERICADELMCGDAGTCVESPFVSDSICQGTPPTP